MIRGFSARMAVLIVAVAVVACGGDADDDAREIDAVIVKALSAREPAAQCEQALSPELIRTIYGDGAACRKLSPGDDQAVDAAVTDIEVDGEEATATVQLVGGPTPGTRGEVELVREESGWRIAELGLDFLRDMLDRGLASERAPKELRDPDVNACVGDALGEIGDGEFRELAYAGMGQRVEAQLQVGALLRACSLGGVAGVVRTGSTKRCPQRARRTRGSRTRLPDRPCRSRSGRRRLARARPPRRRAP